MGLLNFLKRKPCPVYHDHCIWIEQNFLWLMENYGLRYLRSQSIIHITENHFPNLYSQDGFSINGAISDLKSILHLEEFEICAEIKEQARASELKVSEIDHRKTYNISIQEQHLNNIDDAITLLCVEMSKIKLQEAEITIDQEDDPELFLYLVMIYLGFGVIITRKLKFLESTDDEIPLEIQAHCLALYAWLRNENDSELESQLDLKLRKFFRTSVKYYNGAHSSLNKATLEQMDQSNEQLRDSWNFYNQGHYDIAISIAKESLQHYKTNPFIHNSIAEFLIRKGDYVQAMPFLKNALELDHEFSQAHNNLGLCYLMTQSQEKALKKFKEAIELDRGNAFGHRNMGYYFALTNDFDQAFKAFDLALKINPNLELIHYYIGKAHLLNDNKKAAISEFEKSSEKGEIESVKELQNIVGYSWQPRS